MKKLKKLMITVAALMPLIMTASGPVKAYTWGSITPNYGGAEITQSVDFIGFFLSTKG